MVDAGREQESEGGGVCVGMGRLVRMASTVLVMAVHVMYAFRNPRWPKLKIKMNLLFEIQEYLAQLSASTCAELVHAQCPEPVWEQETPYRQIHRALQPLVPSQQ